MHDFTILVLPGAYAASVAVTVDMLQAAAALAPQLRLPQPAWRVVSPDGGPVPLSGGMQIPARRMPLRPRADPSLWIAPGLGLGRATDLAALLAGAAAQRAVTALKRHAAAGGSVAASCSAVFLLQAAGLLAGRRATTSWWLAAELRGIEPACTVDADRMVVSDGPVTTAGAAFGQSDLMLGLLRARFGPALADAVGKVLLVDGRQAQSPFVIPSLLADGNALVGRLTRRIESGLPHPPTVSELASEFAMSPRTLTRHVRSATGQGPLALIQRVRLNRARMLIESSRMGIEQVAAQVGYADATALRRLMRKATGANPSRFRGAA
ncbi:helix-turn-helix domain-containing protein [Acidovorax sp. NCPPB 2350]|nr:helix-turn-helix domain-containing protein [Acidovorax sp. NCPPB 2350]